ncbi:hypothetical protein SO802_020038 [Lithocarpus litseifolius]|uniref:Uncharacterized protein n=1 Tax=Lithocarpus litseifolius TaxID=425828 RepID=A0AAW2CBA8_9ROSI
MSDSNRNWKSRYFFLEGTNWVCREEEWGSIPQGFDNTWAFVRESGRRPLARPVIIEEQEAFILKVTEIPLEERKCRDLITPDALYTYYGGPVPTEEARRAVDKGTPKRKGDGIGDRSAKKQTVTLGDHFVTPLSPKRGAGKGLMTAQGPVTQEDERCLLTHKGYALEWLDSILGKKDADSCVSQSVQELRDSSLFDLARAMVRMRAMQIKGTKSEELLARQKKRITNLTDGLNQYKDACRTLNGKVRELKEKLEEGTRQLEKEREAKVTAEKELTSLLGQVETAKAEAVAEFKTSQTFIDACAEYYGDGFEDCLKQVKSLFPHLDLSKVSMDDLVPQQQEDFSLLLSSIKLEEPRTFSPPQNTPANGTPGKFSMNGELTTLRRLKNESLRPQHERINPPKTSLLILTGTALL